MTVTINAKGTSATSFKIGKRGTTLHQGTSVDPTTVPQGDFWFDSLMGSLRVKGTEPSSWRNLVFDDISFLNNSIISVTGDSTISLNGDIVLTPSSTGNVKVGTNGPPIITTEAGQSLYIEPELYLFLNGLRFPWTDGTSGQAIVTDGAGNLTFGSIAVTLPETQLAFGSASNQATSSPLLTFDDATHTLEIGDMVDDFGLIESVGEMIVKGVDVVLNATSGRVAVATGAATYDLPATDGTNGQYIVTNGTGNLSWATPTLLTTFDSREITDPSPLKSALTLNKKLKPISFVSTSTGAKKLGFIADEVQSVLPFAVTGVKDSESLQAVDTTVFFAHLVACVQELTEKLAKAEAKIAKLEKKNP